ncbi:hypothetical protein [Scytonema sp. UIC 10036]|nr:hypothetical protein [Scytonema sp. UIC 10036]
MKIAVTHRKSQLLSLGELDNINKVGDRSIGLAKTLWQSVKKAI